MDADGYSNVPLWLDEFGYQQDTTNDSRQQSWLTTVLAPGANPPTNIKWYNLRDDGTYCSATTICVANYYGLRQKDLTPNDANATFSTWASKGR